MSTEHRNLLRRPLPPSISSPQLRQLFTAAAVASASAKPWFAPPPPQPSKLRGNNRIDPILTTISESIANSPRKPLHTSLRNLLPSLKPHHIVDLINLNPHSLPPSSLYSFFTWLSSHPSPFLHTFLTYCTMAHFLCTVKMFTEAQFLLRTIVSRKGKNSASAIFASIFESKGTPDSTDRLASFLIIVYLDSGFIPDVIQCFQIIKKHRLRVLFEASSRVIDHLMKSMPPLAAWGLYRELLESGCPPSVYCFNMLMHKLCREGQMREAKLVFDEIGKWGIRPSAVSFNTLINGYCRLGDLDAGLGLKNVMEDSGVVPDAYSYSVLINGHCKKGLVCVAGQLFEEMCERGLVPNGVIFTTLINGHCKAGQVDLAMGVYQSMLRNGVEPDLITYNTLLDGLLKSGDLTGSQKLVAQMKEKGIRPDKITYTTLIDGYCKAGDLDAAYGVRREMVGNGIALDGVAYTSFITGLYREGRVSDAERMLREMSKNGLKPDGATYTMLIDGFCKKRDVKMGFELLREMQRDGYKPGVITYNVIMNGLCKQGQMKNADMLLQAMLNLGIVPDDITYNILLDGHRRRRKRGKLGDDEDEMLRSEMGLVLDYASYSSLIGKWNKELRQHDKR